MSVKVTSNGRSSYNDLKSKFEKVFVTYQFNNDGTGRTTALLVQDGVVHVGVSKFSNRTYQFSKSKGRSMALGRAELAANVFHGVEETRLSKEGRREELSYSVQSSEEQTVENIVSLYINNYNKK